MEPHNKAFELAYCGLVCSRCGAFTRGKCKGCQSPKPMHSQCLVRKCAAGKALAYCADCTDFPDLRDCKKLNNLVSKLFGFVFRSDRIANLQTIRKTGLDEFRILCSKNNAGSPNPRPTKPD